MFNLRPCGRLIVKHLALMALILLTLFAQGAQGEIFEKVGTFGAQFLKIGVSARATAMGSAYTAVSDNAEALYWNPAGIVSVRGSQLNINHVQWPADVKVSSIAYVFNPRSIPGTFGLTARAVWMDPQIVRTAFSG